MQSISSQIGENLKIARKSKGISQTELAKRIGKSLRTMQMYENGESEPTISMLAELAEILETSLAQLLGIEQHGIRLESLSDVMAFCFELNEKAGIRFELETKYPPSDGEYSCAVKFIANDKTAEHNPLICNFLELFALKRDCWETYFADRESYRLWFEDIIRGYNGIKLQNREYEQISDEERRKQSAEILTKRLEEAENK